MFQFSTPPAPLSVFGLSVFDGPSVFAPPWSPPFPGMSLFPGASESDSPDSPVPGPVSRKKGRNVEKVNPEKIFATEF